MSARTQKHTYRYGLTTDVKLRLRDKGIELTIVGLNTKDAPMKVTLRLDWWLVRHVVREIRRLWHDERQHRAIQITKTDKDIL